MTLTAPVADHPATDPAPSSPRWYRPASLVVVALTAVLYLVDLGATGWGNAFYAAAVRASTHSGVAWLFGAVDSPGFITVDKPPADNWIMGLSANLFGLSSWSILVPQALMGVAAVALLMATVRRWSGPVAALLAGGLFALTPVAVVMFRYDNPDGLLTLLLIAAAYATVRAVDAAERRAGTWWLVGAGVAVGFGFLAKMAVAFLVVPALAAAYLLLAAVPWRRRIGQLLASGLAIVVSGGWFVALVSLWPAGSRPWIGGSTDDSLLQLAVGYNGLSRIAGRGGGGAGGGFAGGGAAGRGGGAFGGSAGPTRLFTDQFGGQVAWLLPLALLVLVALLWTTRHAPATDRLRGSLVLWGGWMLVSGAVFSLMEGTVHPYYTVVTAPAIAALVGIGGVEAWRHRGTTAARLLAAVGVLGTALWSAVLLDRTATFVPWLRPVVIVAGLVAAATLLLPAMAGEHRARRAVLAVAGLATAFAVLGGTTAYAVDTAATPHQGGQASAGPATAQGRSGALAARVPTAGREGATRGARTGRTAAATSQAATVAGLGQQAPDPALDALLHTAGTRWAAATSTTSAASQLELAADADVLGIGGFTGSDPTPTLAQFEQLVGTGQIHYYVDASRPGQPAGAGLGRVGAGRGGTTAPIQAWVRAHFAAVPVGAETVYDLTRPTSPTTA